MAVTALLQLLVGVSWVDLTPDLIRDPLRWSRGIFGRGPLDRISRPGVLSFALDNTDQNAAGIESLYSPGHPNCLTGWTHDATVRLRLSDGTNTRYVFRGRLKSILPDPGVTGLRAVSCVASDWLAAFAEIDAANLTLRENVRSDELIEALITDTGVVAPVNRVLDIGQDVYPFAFDDLSDSPKALQIAQDVCQSEVGFLVVNGDATDGETLRFINRENRALAIPALLLTADDLHNAPDAFRLPSTIEQIFNEFEVQTVPRRPSAAPTDVIVRLDSPVEVDAGQTETLFLDYRDPDNEAEFIGGKDMVSPAVTTDWTANTEQDGGGADVSADFSVVATFWGSRCMVEVTNSGGVTGYLRGPGGAEGLQARGRALRRYRPVSSRGENAVGIAALNGRRRPFPNPILMPYQNDRAIGQAAADYFAFVHGAVDTIPERVQPATDADPVLQAHGILRDVGDALQASEDVTGADEARVFIGGLEQELAFNGRLYTWWTLQPRQVLDVATADDVTCHDRVYVDPDATHEAVVDADRVGFAEVGA